jgi:hypothetical protein
MPDGNPTNPLYSGDNLDLADFVDKPRKLNRR